VCTASCLDACRPATIAEFYHHEQVPYMIHLSNAASYSLDIIEVVFGSAMDF
jgi:hypothetical protein